MNFKKKVSGSWTDTPHYIHNTSTDTITTLPAVIHPTGTTATVGLKGNTLQSSIPSPTSPVMPQGTGERTGNLFDYQTMANGMVGKYLAADGSENISNVWSITDYIPVNGTEFTVGKLGGNAPAICLYDANKALIVSKSYNTGGAANKDNITIISSIGAKYARFSWYSGNDSARDDISNVMLNTGSTPLPYEPYGYKIPILSNSATTPVYLGQVESTRQIKKLVLTGEETLTSGSVIGQIRTLLTGAIDSLGLCTHYILKTSYGGAFPYIRIRSNTLWFEISPDGYETKEEALADFKAYLAAQYANGTPVTVWYVLATPTTGIANEPIRKIGNYADSVSGITIPTITGKGIVDVETTLKPSSVSLNYTGWHDAQCKEWDGSDWQ